MTARQAAFRGALDAIDRVLNRGGEAEEILRDVVAILRDRAGYAWVSVRFGESDGLALGPKAGEPVDEVLRVPVRYEGREVAALEVAPAHGGDDEGAFLGRVATLISLQCNPR